MYTMRPRLPMAIAGKDRAGRGRKSVKLLLTVAEPAPEQAFSKLQNPCVNERN
jgi:hypothetical protein